MQPLLTLLLGATMAFAQSIEPLPAHRVGFTYDYHLRALTDLGHSIADPLIPFRTGMQHAAPGSHLVIDYTSTLPVHITYGPITSYTTDGLSAVLPAAKHATVRLPLWTSPAWNPWTEGFVIEGYSRSSNLFEIRNMYTDDDTSLPLQIFSTVHHLIEPQILATGSTNFTLGYRFAGQQLLVVIFGISVMMAIIIVFSRKRPMYRVLPAVFICAALLYQSRFAIDVVRAAVSDHREWLTTHTYNENGDLYSIVDDIRSLENVSEVSHCGDKKTMLEFLLFPLHVDTVDHNIETASHAIISAPYDVVDGTVYCMGTSRQGKVLKTYTALGALVEFTP